MNDLFKKITINHIIYLVIAVIIVGGALFLSYIQKNSPNQDSTRRTFAELVDFDNIPFKKYEMGDYEFQAMIPETWGDMYISKQKLAPESTLRPIYRMFFTSSGNINFVITDTNRIFSEFFRAGDTKEIEDYDTASSKFLLQSFCDATNKGDTTYSIKETKYCKKEKGIWEFEQVQSRVMNGKEVVYNVWGAIYEVPETDMVIMTRYTNFNYKDDFNSFPLEEQTKNNLRYIMSAFAPFSGKPMPASQPVSQAPSVQVETK
jgi:hypothetical protein